MNDDLDVSQDLPAYPGIDMEKICLVQTTSQLAFAEEQLLQARVLGFDTESKPIFKIGQSSDGPHLIQLATTEYAFLFPILNGAQVEFATPVLKAALESKTILKVGFGLGDDNQRLLHKLGVKIAHVLDLSRALSDNRKKQMGAKRAVEKYFGQVLQKSKRVSTSNWAAESLNERQLKYAADDAQSALLVYQASPLAGKEKS
ncbi:3'-5' exonuclease [Undibacterium sp. Di24W]|uniref:3'-5' exonuclease n=1 Tax=Undibacterium sp. Di24W TaxID=3413033 RepID=UPI003BF3D4C9